ncbi:hypothetical protein PoB_003666500 [Plakobranchus ocellatus]|uniref:Uncharacterized protein n=1 Tax=Plakobranchus ocellatus TaxID=259542 RepID=A0AAV4AS91_9GAST|nr:hypothetical protein PoB_003666500 [Plakobranchus ocellatus]
MRYQHSPIISRPELRTIVQRSFGAESRIFTITSQGVEKLTLLHPGSPRVRNIERHWTVTGQLITLNRLEFEGIEKA